MDEFKLDGMIVKDKAPWYIFLVNYNIPEDALADGSLANKLGIVQHQVEDEFFEEIESGRLTYHISACYYLIKKDTGEERLWKGSFQPRTDHDLLLKDFTRYSTQNFVPQVLASTTQQHIDSKLLWLGRDTEWQFRNVTSIIIHFQARCDFFKHPLTRNSGIIPFDKIYFTNFQERTRFTVPLP